MSNPFLNSNDTATSVTLSGAKDLSNIICVLARSLAPLGMTNFLTK
jgi:hypothetical protein